MRPQPGLRRADKSLFARNFFRHPRMLGSIIPSSRFLIRAVLRRISFRRAKLIVEYGPGVGTITGRMLRRMRLDAKLVVIEINPEFALFLRTQVHDPRLVVVDGSAANVDVILRRLGCGSADYVISGIPFSTLPASLRLDILRKTEQVLRPDGAMIVYQFSSRVLADLRQVFGEVERSFEPLNVLPAHIFFCRPRASVRAGTAEPEAHHIDS